MDAREMFLKLRDKAKSVYTHTLQRAYFRLFGHQVDQRFCHRRQCPHRIELSSGRIENLARYTDVS